MLLESCFECPVKDGALKSLQGVFQQYRPLSRHPLARNLEKSIGEPVLVQKPLLPPECGPPEDRVPMQKATEAPNDAVMSLSAADKIRLSVAPIECTPSSMSIQWTARLALPGE